MSKNSYSRNELRNLFRGSFEENNYSVFPDQDNSDDSFEDFRTFDNNNNHFPKKKIKTESPSRSFFGVNISNPSEPDDYSMLRAEDWKPGREFDPLKETPLRPDGKVGKPEGYSKDSPWGPSWQEERRKRIEALKKHPLYRFAENLMSRISQKQLPSLSKSFGGNELEMDRNLRQLLFRQRLHESDPKTIVRAIDQVTDDIESSEKEKENYESKKLSVDALISQVENFDTFREYALKYITMYLAQELNLGEGGTFDLGEEKSNKLLDFLNRIYVTDIDKTTPRPEKEKKLIRDFYSLLSLLGRKRVLNPNPEDKEENFREIREIVNINAPGPAIPSLILKDTGQTIVKMAKSLNNWLTFLSESRIILLTEFIKELRERMVFLEKVPLVDVSNKSRTEQLPEFLEKNRKRIEPILRIILRYSFDREFVVENISNETARTLFKVKTEPGTSRIHITGLIPILLRASVDAFDIKIDKVSREITALKELRRILNEKRSNVLAGKIDISTEIIRKDIMDFSSLTNWLNTGVIPLVDIQGHIDSAENMLKGSVPELRNKTVFWLMTNEWTYPNFAALVAYYVNKADIQHGKTYHKSSEIVEAKKDLVSTIEIFRKKFSKGSLW